MKMKSLFLGLLLLLFVDASCATGFSSHLRTIGGKNQRPPWSRQSWKPISEMRGGARSKALSLKHDPPATKSTVPKPQLSKKTKSTALILVSVVLAYAVWESRESWLGLFDRKQMLENTLQILHRLDQQPKSYSYTIYVLGMAVWELLGLTTIPVETASGMVFGWNGFYLSASGKLLGAVVAFLLARHSALATWIQNKLSTNEVLKLIEDSAESHPLQVAILMKLSCFPETIKNFGSAFLFPIRLWMFVVATVGHGWSYSALWTYLGVDSARRLVYPDLPTDRRLQLLLALAVINGIVVSPLSMTYWIKGMRGNQTENAKSNKNKQKKTNVVRGKHHGKKMPRKR